MTIKIHVKNRIGCEGYGVNRNYCPKCCLAFEVEPPDIELIRCPLCHSLLRKKPRRDRKALLEKLPRVDPAKYGVSVDG